MGEFDDRPLVQPFNVKHVYSKPNNRKFYLRCINWQLSIFAYCDIETYLKAISYNEIFFLIPSGIKSAIKWLTFYLFTF